MENDASKIVGHILTNFRILEFSASYMAVCKKSSLVPPLVPRLIVLLPVVLRLPPRTLLNGEKRQAAHAEIGAKICAKLVYKSTKFPNETKQTKNNSKPDVCQRTRSKEFRFK